MKQIEQLIWEMDKKEAKMMKYVAELAIWTVDMNSDSTEQAENVDEVLEMIISRTKERIRKLAGAEIENA